MNVLEAINRKRAIRSFVDQPVPLEDIYTILDAGRKAQSSRNSQPTRFIIVTDREKLSALSELGNFSSHLAEAAAGIAILTPDTHQNLTILFDAGQAAAYIQLAALELGLATCVVKLHRGSLAGEVLQYPEEYQLDFLIALGYPKEHRKTGLGKLERKPLEDLVFRQEWEDE